MKMMEKTVNTNGILAKTPPLGWNSFDSYGVYLHEKAAFENLEVMAEKLKPSGYEYFVIDNGWFGEFELEPGTIYPKEKHAAEIRIDENGLFVPSETYFPNGLEPIVNRCHELGLKFGIHLMRGIPRRAVEEKLLIQGTSITADQVAITDEAVNCKWCDYCYCVDHSKAGAQEWYNSLVKRLASWGVDMIKYDDIVPYPEEIEMVVKAIENSGRPMLLSLSPGGKVDPAATSTFEKANMLRVTPDIWDDSKGTNQCFDAWKKWNGVSKPGFWVDMDMIPFGQLQLMCPSPADGVEGNSALFSGRGFNRQSEFSKDQMLTFITMRALSASPLMMGGDLPTLDDYSYSLITNEEILTCNQNGIMGTLLSEKEGIEIWKTPLADNPDHGWIGVFNRNDKGEIIQLNESMLDLNAGSPVMDIWNDCQLELMKEVSVQGNGVLFLKY